MRWFIFFFLTFATSVSQGNSFLNLDFELAINGSNKPKKWYCQPKNCDTKVDSVVRFSGHYSLKVTSEGGYASCSNVFPIESALGKTIKICGYIKTENLIGGTAGFWCRIEGRRNELGKNISFENMETSGPTGTTSWKKYFIDVEVDSLSENIVFGCNVNGRGQAWFDHIEIYVSNVKYNDVVPTITLPTKEDFRSLCSVAIPLVSPLISTDNSDLKPLKGMIQNTKILALGEVTHGSSEIFKMKSRVVKYLIEENGFDVFALEACMPEAYRLNEYITNGKGNPKDLINKMHFWIWETEEMLALINWMREYNSQHGRKIKFTGIDMQYYNGALDEIEAICRTGDNFLIGKSLDSLKSHLQVYEMCRKNKEEQTSESKVFFKEKWAELRNFAKNIVDSTSRNWFLQNVRILEQYSREYDGVYRDICMAENALWIRRHNSSSKMIIWAHNSHIQKMGKSMGSYISEKLKDEYKAVAFTFHEGAYTGRDDTGITKLSAQTSYPGTFEYYFHSCKIPFFLLNLSKPSKEINRAKWLYSEHEFRNVGALKMEDEFSFYRLYGNFDMLIYIAKSSNSILFTNEKVDAN